MYEILCRLATEHEVYLLYLGETGHEVEEWGRTIGIKQVYAVESPAISAILWPRSYYTHRSLQLRALVKSLDQKYGFDVVNVEYTQMAYVLGRREEKRALLVEHDITYVTLYRQALQSKLMIKKSKILLTAAFFYVIERRWWHLYHTVICMSENDAAIVRKAVPKQRVVVVPNGAEIPVSEPGDKNPDPKNPTILFVGDFRHFPNVDAVEYFLDEVYPRVRTVVPKVQFIVAGKSTPQIESYHAPGDGISVVGYTEDLSPLYRSASVAIAPIRFGSGTRLKILQAMAHGVPVVSTTLGAEGLDVYDGEHMMIADSPDNFCSAIIHTLDRPVEAVQRAIAAHELVKSNYSWERIYCKYRIILEEIYVATRGRNSR